MIDANHIYTLVNSASGTVLNIDGGSPVNGSVCQGWQDLSYQAEAFNQQWLVTAVEGMIDTFTLRNLRSGTYLDMAGGSSANGTRVQGHSKAALRDEKNQHWKLIPEDQYYRLQNVSGANYLDLDSGRTANGTKVQGYQKVDTPNQKWSFHRVSRAGHEIEELVKQNRYIGNNFKSYLQDGLYIVLPKNVRNVIYKNTGLTKDMWRDEIFDCDDFAFVVKAAIAKWGGDYLRADGFAILFGTMFGSNDEGAHAYNWYLNQELNSIVFFEPQEGIEMVDPGYMGYFSVF